MEERIGLKSAIGALREELSESILAAANEKLQFEVGEITLEFQVEVERAGDLSSKFNIWVVEVGSEVSTASSKTHKVVIPLKPVTSDRQPVLTSARRNIDRN